MFNFAIFFSWNRKFLNQQFTQKLRKSSFWSKFNLWTKIWILPQCVTYLLCALLVMLFQSHDMNGFFPLNKISEELFSHAIVDDDVNYWQQIIILLCSLSNFSLFSRISTMIIANAPWMIRICMKANIASANEGTPSF